MQILTAETLPPTQEEYFTFYHNRAFDPALNKKNEKDRNEPCKVRDNDLEDILGELRLAYKKYENKTRIHVMAKVVELGIKRSKGKIKDLGFTHLVKQSLE